MVCMMTTDDGKMTQKHKPARVPFGYLQHVDWKKYPSVVSGESPRLSSAAALLHARRCTAVYSVGACDFHHPPSRVF